MNRLMKMKKVVLLAALTFLVTFSTSAEVYAEASSVVVAVDTTFVKGADVEVPVSIVYGSVDSLGCTLSADGVELMSSTENGVYRWCPNSLGEHTLVWSCGNMAMTTTVNVVSLVMPAPEITPLDGTVIGDSQSVLISCDVNDAQIYYTTDGSEPTTESTLYQKRFRVSGKTTVKAIAMREGLVNSEIAVANYALGQCPEPVIASAGGETFLYSSNQVSIAWECVDGVLRYTTDGSDVTEKSPIYAGTFTVNDTTVIKARAFGETYFDSQQVELTVTRKRELVATPTIAASEMFSGSKTIVAISCATEGALIRYTTDGSEPNSHSRRYSGPFEVRETTVVKAFAMLDDYANSEIAEKSVTKVRCVGDSVGLPDHAFTTEGNAGWVDEGGVAMRSGAIADEQVSTLKSTFVGKGRLTFDFKTSCEEDDPAFMEYDHAEIWIDNVCKVKQDGVHDWSTLVYELGEGPHVVEWKYVKDELDDKPYPGEDCVWVRNVVWLPESTCTTEVPVPLSWIREKFGDLGSYYYDYEEKANGVAANGHKVWECYVAGEDSTDAASKLTALIEMSNGVPQVSWTPDLNEGAGKIGARVYTIMGSNDLKNWSVVSDGREANFKFFKVVVEMPR